MGEAAVLGLVAPASVVVFDLDGTLYDEGIWLRAADAALGGYLVERTGRPSDEVTRAVAVAVAGGRPGYLDRLVTSLELSREDLPRMLTVVRGVRPPLHLHPWVRPVLELFWGHGLATSVLTNGDPGQQAAKAALLGLDDVGPLPVVFAKEHGAKPAPDGLQYILGLASVRPDEAVMIGDHTYDEDCARRTGVRYVPVTDLVSAVSDVT